MAWDNKPSSFALSIQDDAEKHIKKISMEVVQSLMIGSPVMDGAYRSSHVLSINSTDSSIRQNENKAPIGNIDPASFNESAQKAVGIKLGDTIYIQNNLPYAPRIENGWSQQATNGVYGLTFNYITSKYK